MSMILVADPDPDFRCLMDDVLSDLGHHVVGIQRSENAAEVARALMPDLVIMDILMDRAHHGCKVLKSIKDNPHTAATPVVACTALTNEQVTAQTKEQPLLSGILPRPFELEALERMVTEILNPELVHRA